MTLRRVGALCFVFACYADFDKTTRPYGYAGVVAHPVLLHSAVTVCDVRNVCCDAGRRKSAYRVQTALSAGMEPNERWPNKQDG